MRYIEAERRIVWSASDMKAAAECEFAWLRKIDAKAGRVPGVIEPEDAMLARAAELGNAHELRTLERYRTQFGDAVVEVPQTASWDASGLALASKATHQALRDPAAQVIFQAAFSTTDFVGFADFLVRDEQGRWIVQDTKLARRARVTALMQLAAYVDQLDQQGVPRADRVELLLGDGSTSSHAVTDVLPVFALRRARLRALVVDRRLSEGATGAALDWNDDRGELGVVACGRCATCEEQVVAHRDTLLVAGMRPVHRQRLREVGITTIDELASATTPPSGMSADAFEGLVTQARLQISSPAGVPEASASEGHAAVPSYEVVFPRALGAMPKPNAADIFFDFEGDPLHTEALARAEGGGSARENASLWGIDYLFGWVDNDEQYSALWAHTFAEEKQAFERFLDIVALRRRAHPDMHIYHYAPYEPTHLAQMAARYGVREAEVDQLLRDGVFVDLYPIVKRALRVGSRSYSIKKLEPLYMGDEVRVSTVQRGDDSIVKYVQARTLVDAGDHAAAQPILDDLADYNRYDCVSTRRLRDWLVDRAREAGLTPSVDSEPTDGAYESSHRAITLAKEAEGRTGDDQVALLLAAAAIDYYPREAKSFWFGHYTRLREPVTLWEDTRDVIVFDAAQCRVVRDWHSEGRQRTERRILELRGTPAPGTRLSAGGRPYVIYERPAPFPVMASPRWFHIAREVKTLEVLADTGDAADAADASMGILVEELALDGFTWSELPLALAPASPPPVGKQQDAINAWADTLISASPDFPRDAATDMLRRIPPRLRRKELAPSSGDDVAAITRSILDVDRSYLAVQGPPGTGKTYVGAHVIADLVMHHRYRVGIVAQSHAVVENMLDRCIAAGVPTDLVGKAPSDPTQPVAFTAVAKHRLAGFAKEHAQSGFVIGGTAWDLSHPDRVAPGSLDLLVVDEAGQFSLASTIAVARSAQRVMLLGDPQQLPQVSQGTHPQPVDTSALGWVMADHAVIAPDRGYFLARTWRMHPAVADAVSALSYEGKLTAQPHTALRTLEGIDAGVHAVAVAHTGNATQSPQEAAAVVDIVRDALGRLWREPDAATEADHAGRALTQRDIIVVTPYNAQQITVQEALIAAGYNDVRVGTVDKFQGQEAVIAIVSLAASSSREAPRGIEFLLLQNRLNVAISRAKYAAYMVYSPGVLDGFPHSPEGVAQLSAFARLVSANS